ncbi:MAG: Ig-like domain-containing protein [Mycobacterium sp.]|nr:Ig-like domain-containing protein [Mycobacterium sp.]
MSKFAFAAPLGAVALATGLALATPVVAAAEADAAGASTAAAVDSTDSTTSSGPRQAAPTTRKPAQTSRAAKSLTAPEVAAPATAPAEPSRPTAASIAAGIGSIPKLDRVAPQPSRGQSRATRSPADSSAPRAALKPNTPSPNTPSPTNAGESSAAETEAPVLATPAAVTGDVTSAPTALAPATRVTANATLARAPLAAAAASATDPLSGLLSPIQGLIEGIALLVRRTFFNQAPSVSPVQLTGQSEGPITGSIGASDPEGDRIVYSLTGDAQYGSVAIDSAGGYTYTPGPGFTGIDTFTVAAADPGFHINLLDLFRPPSTTASVAVRQGVGGGSLLQFQFVYGSGSQLWSLAAKRSLASAAAALASYIVVDSPVVITFDVSGEFNPLSSTLATAGSDFTSAGPGFLPTVVQHKILTGVDTNGSTADGEINWNFAQNWATGDSVVYGQYDLESVAMHELTHTLGFLSYTDQPGSNTGTTWTVFDSFLVNSDGTKVIGSDYIWRNAYTPNLTGGNGGLYVGGADAVAAYGGLVPIYTPGSWESGSSVSHLNDRVFGGANRKLMNAQVFSGLGIRVLSPVELAILADLGYTIAPQPGSAALAFIGVFFLRRTRRR